VRDLRTWSGLTAAAFLAASAGARPLPENMATQAVPAGTWRNATVAGGAVSVELEMGTKRVNWNHARWAVLELPKPADLSAFDGLALTVETDRPRADAWVDVAVMEDDGSWYYLRDAVPLTRKTNRAVADLALMRNAEWVFNADGTGPGGEGNYDEDFHLDRTRIARIAVGVVNAHGVGTVAFRIRKIELARWKPTQSDRPVELAVTGRLLTVNGTDRVPGGIFGFHQAGGAAGQVKDLRVGSLRPHRALGAGGHFVVPPDPANGVAFFVACNYDRKQAFPQFWKGDWRAKLREVGAKIGQAARPHGRNVAVEWWNEPYLDFARMLPGLVRGRAGKNPDVKPDDPVFLGDRKLESMRWARVADGQGAERLMPKDPTRFTYWSGRQIGIFYTEGFNLVAAEARKAAPEMRLVGGFGFRWNEDDWASWEILYQDFLDASAQVLDGVCEHHYQGHTDGMAASYEVLAAYTETALGKRLPAYNTETNDLWDAPARGRPASAGQKDTFRPRRRMIYNLRDILYCLRETPDKIVTRAIHMLQKPKGDATPWQRAGVGEGEYNALWFLRDLRGRLVETTGGDEELWALASLDETAGRLVTVLYNDGPRARKYAARIAAPGGTRLAGGTVGYCEWDATGGVDGTRTERLSAAGAAFTAAGELKPRHAVRYTLAVQGKAQAAQVVREQTFCEGVLRKIAPGASARLTLHGTPAAGARRAWVRLVVEHCGPGEGRFEIGGKRFAIPPAYTPHNCPYICQVEIDPALLNGARALTFHAAGMEAGNGYLLCMASVVTEK